MVVVRLVARKDIHELPCAVVLQAHGAGLQALLSLALLRIEFKLNDP